MKGAVDWRARVRCRGRASGGWGRAHLRYQPAVDENDEDVEHRMRDRGWSRNLHVVVRRRSRSASGVGRARLLAVERDLAEARRRRAVDQWNCVGGRGHLLSENM